MEWQHSADRHTRFEVRVSIKFSGNMLRTRKLCLPTALCFWDYSTLYIKMIIDCVFAIFVKYSSLACS